MTDATSVAKGQESVNSLDEKNIKPVSCSRKEIDESIKLLIKKNNKFRFALVNLLYPEGSNEQEKEKLLDLVKVGKKEHDVLKALFERIDWSQKDLIDQEKSPVFPKEVTIQEDTNLCRSSVSAAKTRLQNIFLISWVNRYKQDRNGELKNTSNQYYITERVLRLAEFTKISLKKDLLKEDHDALKVILSDFLLPRPLEKTGHQKSGQYGVKKKKFRQNTKWLLNLALRELSKGPSSCRYYKCLRVLDLVSVRMDGLSKESFKMSKSSIIKTWTPGLQVLEGGRIQNLDPQGPSSGPKYSPLNVPSEMTQCNKTTTTVSKPVGKTQKQPNVQKVHFNEEECKKIFDLFSSLFGKRVATNEAKKFRAEAKKIQPTLEEVLGSLKVLASDKYLKATTKSVNRVFDIGTALSIVEDVKTALRSKKDFCSHSIKPLGEISILAKIFPKPADILHWAGVEGFENYDPKQNKVITHEPGESEDKGQDIPVKLEETEEHDTAEKKSERIGYITETLLSKLGKRNDEIPLVDEIVSLTASKIYEEDIPAPEYESVYEDCLQKKCPDRYGSWGKSKEKLEFIQVGSGKDKYLRREIRNSFWGISKETGLDDDRCYYLGKCWRECGFKDNEEVYTSQHDKLEKIYSWLNANCDGLYTKLCTGGSEV